ncbi:MAG: hypothetical protein IJ298_01235 [Ruminococcus sp.]|nr:hypothetical protein [Ruminococcus sp.]
MNFLKKIAKRLVLGVLCLSILVSICCIGTSAASIYTRPDKHIYLVMDDSGSMEGVSEHDANYSLQTLLAMTDKTDTVDLYFLNSKSTKIGELDLTNKSNKMLENVRVNYPSAEGGTPYDVVIQAQKDLKNDVKDNSDDEYWLIVVTDGGFGSPSMDYEADLVTFSETQLKNGTYPQILCVAINNYSFISQGNRKDNLSAVEGADVITSMNEAAKIISDRIEIADTKLSSDGKSLSFTTPYPAKNIIILAQKTKTSITNYSCSTDLKTDEAYEVVNPNTNTPSTVCFVTEKSGGSIPSGKVSFDFSNSLDASNTVVLIEPAIALTAHFYNQDGNECDPQDLRVGESAKLVFTICDPSTNQPIDESTIDGGVSYSADINGTTYNDNEIDFMIDSKDLVVDMYAQFTDGFTLDIHKEFLDLEDMTLISMVVSDGGNFSEDLYSLDDSDFITITPYANGNAFTSDLINKSNLKITGDNPLTSRFEIKPNPDSGTFTIHPKGGIFKVFTPYVTELEVTLEPPIGDTVTERVTVELTGPRNWIPFILTILGILVLIYLIIVYSYKKKFPLDLRLYSYQIAEYGVPINVKTTTCKAKTVFHPGVIDLASALPHFGPFKIRLSSVSSSYGDLILIANGNTAFVQNVKKISVDNPNDANAPVANPLLGNTTGQYGAVEAPGHLQYKILPASQEIDGLSVDYADQVAFGGGAVNHKYKNILIIKDGEFLQEQPYSPNYPKLQLRYVRKRTQKKNREI